MISVDLNTYRVMYEVDGRQVIPGDLVSNCVVETGSVPAKTNVEYFAKQYLDKLMLVF